MLNHLGDVLGEKWAVKVVVVGSSGRDEGGLIWGTTECNKLVLVILEQNLNVGRTLLLLDVLDEVLTIIVIVDLAWDLSTVLVFDDDLELITARFSVLAFIITCLNDELNWLTNSLLLEDTWTEAKRLSGTGIQEVVVVDEGGGHTIFAFEDKLYSYGGWNSETQYNDVVFWDMNT